MRTQQLSIIILLIITVCSQRASAQIPEQSDTLRLSLPSVVFYTPSQTEAESLSAHSVFVFDSLSKEFSGIKERIAPFLNKKGIAAVSSSARYFIAERNDSLILDRKSQQKLFGIIYYTGKKGPLVQPGIHSDSEVFTAMMRYFEIRR